MYNKERREAKRISYICEVQCEGAGASHLSTRITDLSATGAFIDVMTPFAPGSIIKLRFRVQDRVIEADAEVRYSLRGMGIGVRFLYLKSDQLAVIEHLVEGKPLPPPAAEATSPGSAQRPPMPQRQTGALAPNLLVGNFAMLSLFDVIQMMESNRLTGALIVDSDAAKGEIYFNGGLIVGAQSGAIRGTEALTYFLDITDGYFEFQRSNAEYERTIQASSNMGLMLGLLRVKDEEAAFAQPE